MEKIPRAFLSKFRTVIRITVVWTIISMGNYAIAHSSIISMGFDIERDAIIPFQGSILTGILAGLLGGSVIVFVWDNWLRTKPYGWTLKSIFFTYVIVFILVAVPTGLFFNASFLDLPFYNEQVLSAAWKNLTSLPTLVPFTFWLMVVIATMIVLIVDDKYGPGVFQKFLLGQYFNPKREERVFMFLDLRSSTSIAESIGEEKYFNFLKDAYKFATPGILKYQGEIYQYVGDEVVVSWPLISGINEANCIRCFFEIQKLIHQKKTYFENAYDVIPEFKAGLHYGNVMAGEIGVVKRDIAFSGDVMNTTSRIQNKCNELGVNILISRNLIEKIKLTWDGYSPKEMGEMLLRGKSQKISLYTI